MLKWIRKTIATKLCDLAHAIDYRDAYDLLIEFGLSVNKRDNAIFEDDEL